MARAKISSGFGTTISFGTSSFTAQITGIRGPGRKRNAYSTSHMGTAAPGVGELCNETFVADTIYDNGELVLDINFNPDTIPPICSTAETITITYPVPTGGSTGTTHAFTGAIIKYENVIPMKGKMTATVTVAVSGKITITPGS